ncbi:helix-turn-helix domain-containing protein [Streptomyces sp. 11-1-2]|uniref:helix-turn-helix domain-containing protein n=1 Tax=unclassified Streptomyces TaxID=2593676 RepID=UPI001F08B06E|nr:helix-turn-helix domain-containing protein [Streptomyces sp. 11-1-2]
MTAKLEGIPRVPRGKRLLGNDRERVREIVSVVYKSNPKVSIRDISEATGRSFGFIHELLIEAGVELRSRGGSYALRKGAGD